MAEKANDFKEKEKMDDVEGYMSEKLYQLRKERGGYKGSLTRKKQEIEDLMFEGKDNDSVSAILQEYKATYTHFQEKHNQYKDLLDSDAEEFQTANEYYDTTSKNVETFIKHVEEWMQVKHESDKSLDKHDDIIPEDSASQMTKGSSLSSVKLRAKAKKAMLLAKAQALSKQQSLKLKQLELQQLEEAAQIEGELAAVEAEEKVYEEHESQTGSRSSKHKVKITEFKTSILEPTGQTNISEIPNADSKLNPKAPIFYSNTQTETPINYIKNESHIDYIAHAKGLEQSLESQHSLIQALQSKVDSLLLTEVSTNTKQNNHVTKQTTPITQRQSVPILSAIVNGAESGTGNAASNHCDMSPAENNMLILQQRMLEVVQLPRVELMTFDGDPLKYWAFVRSFQGSVDSTSVSDNVKLNRLFQYCTGRALLVIQCCSLMPPDQGYIQAWRLLKERFGNEFEISKAWVEKVTDGPCIKPSDKQALRQYADDVNSCVLTLDAMGKIGAIDNQSKMLKMVEKLPFFLQGRWRKNAIDLLGLRGQYPDIRDLAVFIEKSAQEMNDPVYGSLQGSSRNDVKDQSRKWQTISKRQSTNFNVQATNPENHTNKDRRMDESLPPCYMCSGNHLLHKCQQFKGSSVDQRRDWVRTRKLCFNCFSANHMSNTCDKLGRCDFPDCKGKHSKYLHINKQPNSHMQKKPSQAINHETTSKEDQRIAAVHNSTCTSVNNKVALPVVPVKVRAHKNQEFITTFALLDTGSTNSFCTQELIDQLGGGGFSTTLSLTTMSSERQTTETKRLSLEVADVCVENTLQMPHVYMTQRLPSLADNVAGVVDVCKWPHLSGINFPEVDGDKVMLLIGQDNPGALIPLEVCSGTGNQPYATRTVFGWTLNGPLQSLAQRTIVSNFIHSDQTLTSQVERFWTMETSESSTGELQLSLNDKKVVDLWQDKSLIVDGHYQLNIPFKRENDLIPNNFIVAKGRLASLERKLRSSPAMFQRYKTEIQGLLRNGYAEIVPKDELFNEFRKVWYLPHHAVFNVNKPDKLRVVFDCSAEYMGRSLNDYILQGPDLTNSLIGVLFRFREWPVGIMADIEAMFHQVKVAPEDRDVLRFLWWKGDDMNREPEILRMTVHPFGGVWSPSCASFALQRTAEDNALDVDQSVSQTVQENFYVDDLLKSVSTVDEAVHLVKELRQLLLKGGFNLTKFVSNNKQHLEAIPKEHRGKQVKEFDNFLPVERALGVQWDMHSDQFSFNIKQKDRPFTRRGMMSVICSIYDPLGIASPFVLQAKKLLQNECRSKKGWDEALNPSNQDQWKCWLQDLHKLSDLKVDRCIRPQDFQTFSQCEIHHFADASLDGFGTVSYLRTVNSEGKIHIAFLIGKSRLSPIKQTTIPRLELSAAVLAVKVDSMIRRELKIEVGKSVFWTDSMIVLHYISNTTKRFQMFVANRVAQIHGGSDAEQWRHVNSASNPADDSSRGLTAQEIVTKTRWLTGPDFLHRPENKWPPRPRLDGSLLENDTEVKRDVKIHTTLETGALDKLFTRYSSWYRLKRGVAWLLRLKDILLEKVRASDHLQVVWNKGNLKVADLKRAETEIVKFVQHSTFQEELQVVSKGKAIKKSSNIFTLEPVLDSEGVMCVRGRLPLAPVSSEARHPRILPKKLPTVQLLIRHYHEILIHSGKEHVLSELRKKFWVINARSTVKKV